MGEINFRKVGLQYSKLLDKDQLYAQIMNDINSGQKIHKKRNYKLRWGYRGIIAAVLLLVCMANVAVYAISPDFRELLAEKLHIGSTETHYVGQSVCDQGITMTVISSHVSSNSAVVLLAFSKDNKESFGNSLNPYKDTIVCNNTVPSSVGVYTELSDDFKTLYCYYTWILPTSTNDKQNVTVTINNLICNQSEAEGVTFPDKMLYGKWNLQFELLKDKDNTVRVDNPDISQTVTMCGKKLQIDSAVLTDMLLIINTTILSDSGMPEDPLSNIYPGSGAYSGVFTQLVYKDGTASEQKDCALDEDGNIITWFPETIKMGNVKEIHVGDVVIPVKN
jgi:hypothetical protein